jgi:hypothetical protein
MSPLAYDQDHGQGAFASALEHATTQAESEHARLTKYWAFMTWPLAFYEDRDLPTLKLSTNTISDGKTFRAVLAPGIVLNFDKPTRRLTTQEGHRFDVLKLRFEQELTDDDRHSWLFSLPQSDLWLLMSQTGEYPAIEHVLRQVQEDAVKLAIMDMAFSQCPADLVLDHWAVRNLLMAFSGDDARLEFLRQVKLACSSSRLTIDLWTENQTGFLGGLRSRVARREALEILLGSQ